MLSATIEPSGTLTFSQRLVSPAVYLDHWALREISESEDLSGRFSRALEQCGGTLALSWANLIDFTKITREGQLRLTEAFIDSNIPRVFFLEAAPTIVIGRENELLQGTVASLAPHSDNEFFKIVLNSRTATVKPFAARDLFEGLRGELGALGEEFADEFVSSVSMQRRRVTVDPSLKSRLQWKRGPTTPRATRLINRELLRGLVLDQGRSITRQDAIDFFHAVVPVAYCDVVLLDKHWADKIERVWHRFSAEAIGAPLARVISKRDGGLSAVVSLLETAPP